MAHARPDFRTRFDSLGERLERGKGPRSPGAEPGTWAALEDLFTRDVTGQGLRQLVEYDARDTLRFFARGVDLGRLSSRPWWKRWPLTAWALFLATAHRLSPARRVLFALAVPIVALAWLRLLLLGASGHSQSVPNVFSLLVLASTALVLLLVLELRDKLALKSDLEVAREIQFGLLPFEPYRAEGVDVRALMRPANTVGGDYFDLIDVHGGKLGVVIGDVAGKGMPAALLMALLQGSLRTLLSAGLRGTSLVGALNEHLHANIPSNRLVTLFYAEYEPATGALVFVNAGHNPPFLLGRGGAIERLEATGLALGVAGGQAYEAGTRTLEPGDRLLLYTDGVTEASDARDEEYGEGRVEAYLRRRADADAASLVEGLRDEVLAFCGVVRPRDDMTLLLLSRPI